MKQSIERTLNETSNVINHMRDIILTSFEKDIIQSFNHKYASYNFPDIRDYLKIDVELAVRSPLVSKYVRNFDYFRFRIRFNLSNFKGCDPYNCFDLDIMEIYPVNSEFKKMQVDVEFITINDAIYYGSKRNEFYNGIIKELDSKIEKNHNKLTELNDDKDKLATRFVNLFGYKAYLEKEIEKDSKEFSRISKLSGELKTSIRLLHSLNEFLSLDKSTDKFIKNLFDRLNNDYVDIYTISN